MARYVKILIDKGENPWGHEGYLSVIEIKVFSNNINVALGKPCTDTTGNSVPLIVNNIISTSIDTELWATPRFSGLAPMGSQWILIDLKNNYIIDKIEFSCLYERGFGPVTDYRIMFSFDNINFWQAAKVTAKPAAFRTDSIIDIKNFYGYMLYLKNSNVYGVKNDIFTKLTDNWTSLSDMEKISLFEQTANKFATANDLYILETFKLLFYQVYDTEALCTVTAVPKDQLILPKELINIESFEGIDKVTLASNATNNGTVKLLVTNDLNNYQIYDFLNSAWQAIDHADLEEVLSQGISASDIQNITRDSWDIITNNKSGIGFAYLLKMEDIADGCDIDKISLTVDMKGTWEKSTHGSDYKYGYPSNKTLRLKLLASGDYKINYSEGEKKV